MISRLVILAALAGALGAAGAHAEESVSILGSNPGQVCSDLAAQATRTGQATEHGLAVCTDAIKNAPLTRGELAATYLNRSVLSLARADYAAAIADDDAALRLVPDLSAAYVNRGAALSAEKRFADAVGDFSHALTLDPKAPEAVYFDRALAKEDLGDLKGAYLDYRKAAELSPAWEAPRKELARFKVAPQAMS